MRRRSHPRSVLTLALFSLGLTATAQAAPPNFRRSAQSFPEGTTGTRVAFGDVDSDGDPDVLISGKLYLNDGTGTFSFARNSGLGPARAAVFADYDRDGDLDVYLSGHGLNADRLMRNDTRPGRRPVFTDVSAKVGVSLNDGLPGEGVGWGDLNGDGYPDLYVANYEWGSLGAGRPDRLYLSNGQGGFYNASGLILASRWGAVYCGRGVSMADYDLDGDTDVFVSNYRLQPNLLWVNSLRNGSGIATLSEQNYASGLGQTLGSHTIGSAWGDVDNDGDLDLVQANLAHPWARHYSERTLVFLQDAAHRFTKVTAGIKYEETHSDPTLFDVDNDGDLDLYLTSVYGGRQGFLYRNRTVEDGRFHFRDCTELARAKTYDGWGAAAADVDLDGDLDLVVCAGGRPVLLINTRSQETQFKSVRLRLRGTLSDTWGAGATVILTGDGVPRQVRQLSLGHGTSSQSEPILHFGVGRAQGPFQLEVRWPSGRVGRHRAVVGLNEVDEGIGSPRPPAPFAGPVETFREPR
ncbi:MAG: CRTAC1 family protein [Planctomycetota bacterium]